ncbi:P2 family phage major capsid protein, partial [Klebsiella pneumoniae]|uniref:P2 family phage major capsid protein n=1 Tax=Klebsiella pneumoniae TaxID=573 RepID=UPI000BC45652
MKKNTRFAFNAYLQQLARLNGVAVEELSSKFTVEPSVQQTLEDQIQQSAAFLTLINVTPVTEQSGQLLGLGWLQKIREDAPDHVMGSTTTGGETIPGAVKVGKGGEYANLDAVVMDAVNELIDVVYQDDDDLVVICGRELLSDKYFPLVNKEQENSEKLA